MVRKSYGVLFTFDSKEIYINDLVITNISNQNGDIAWLNIELFNKVSPQFCDDKTISYYNTDASKQSIVTFTIPNSFTCFLENSVIETDQGHVKIQNLNENNTYKGLKLLGFSKGYYSNKFILIKKSAIAKNIPDNDTYITPEHAIIINNCLFKAEELLRLNNVCEISFKEAKLVYNPLFEKWIVVNVNNTQI